MEESAGKVAQEEEVKNEPNSAVSPAEPPATSHERLDSRFRGNDESQAGAPVPQEMKNEPNSEEEVVVGANLAKACTSLRKVGPAQGEMELKNEPNSGDFRMPNAIRTETPLEVTCSRAQQAACRRRMATL